MRPLADILADVHSLIGDLDVFQGEAAESRGLLRVQEYKQPGDTVFSPKLRDV